MGRELLRPGVKQEHFDIIKKHWQYHHYRHGNCETARLMMSQMVTMLTPLGHPKRETNENILR